MVPAIHRYADKYGEQPENVRIKMSLDEKGRAIFWTVTGRQVREQVKFLHLYHGEKAKIDVTGRVPLIRMFIRKALTRLAGEHHISPDLVNVMVVLDGKETFLFLMNGLQKVKMLDEEEIMSDEQISVDAIEPNPEMQENE